MNSYLALDIGRKKTGVAYTNDSFLVPVSLQTISTLDPAARLHHIKQYCLQHAVTHIIVGLPLLPSGEKGAQARYTMQIVSALQTILPASIQVVYIDERYTSSTSNTTDTDAAAAIKILQIYLDMYHR